MLSWEERGLISPTAAGKRAYASCLRQLSWHFSKGNEHRFARRKVGDLRMTDISGLTLDLRGIHDLAHITTRTGSTPTTKVDLSRKHIKVPMSMK